MGEKPVAAVTAVAVLALCGIVLFWPWLSGAMVIPWDARNQTFPDLRFMAAELARGAFPGWNPYVWSGWPQIADPQGLTFSLPHLVLAALTPEPSAHAAGIAAIAPLFVGAAGLLLHCRDRRWRVEGGLVAGIAFMFGGVAATRLEHVGQIQSLGLLAFTLWPLHRAVVRGSPAWGAFAGLSAGLMIAAPDQVAFLGMPLLAGLALPRLASSSRPGQALTALVIGALVAGAIVAVPLLAVTDLLAASNRPAIAFAEAEAGSLHPAFLLTAILPNVLGTLDAGQFWGPGSAVWGGPPILLSPAMGQMYFGVLPLLLLVLHGLAARRLADPAIRPEAIGLAVLILYALGSWTPVFRAIFAMVPAVDLFRRPADAAFPIGLLVALLSGYLMHRCLEDGPPAPSARRALIVGIGACGLAGLILLLSWSAGRMAEAGLALLSGGGVLAAGLLVLRLAAHWRGPRFGPAGMVLIAALTLDLAWVNGPDLVNGAAPQTYDAFQPTDPIALALRQRVDRDRSAIRRDRVEILGLGGPWQNASMAHRLENTLGYNPLRLNTYEDSTGAWENSFDAASRRFVPLFPSYRCLLADLLGLRWIVTGLPMEEIDPRLPPGGLIAQGRIGNAYLYENPGALPRVLLVTAWREADFAQIIDTGAWGGFDPRHVALLDPRNGATPPAEVPRDRRADGPDDPDTIGSVAIVSYGSNEIIVDVTARVAGLVVLNDLWHHWWRATLDGRPVPLLRANVLFRAVATPAGQHRIAFTFDPLAGIFETVRALVD